MKKLITAVALMAAASSANASEIMRDRLVAVYDFSTHESSIALGAVAGMDAANQYDTSFCDKPYDPNDTYKNMLDRYSKKLLWGDYDFDFEAKLSLTELAGLYASEYRFEYQCGVFKMNGGV